jgi:hypothetical protein
MIGIVKRLPVLCLTVLIIKSVISYLNKRKRIPKGKSKMDHPEKLATLGTEDEDKQSKNTTQYELDATTHKQTS